MKTRLFFLCLTAAAGIGKAADAATYNARYIETLYGSTDIIEYLPEKDDYTVTHFNALSSRDDIWGLETLLPGMKSGDELSFDKIGLGCAVGPMTCDQGLEDYYGVFQNDPLFFGGENFYIQLDGALAAGTTIEIWDIEAYHGHVSPATGSRPGSATGTPISRSSASHPCPCP